MNSNKELEPTHQEHGLEQVTRAHAPCMGAWTPNAWVLFSALGVRLASQHPCGLGLSSSNSTCLGSGSAFGPTFISNSPSSILAKEFFSDPKWNLHYFILI
jgi:hypothetical protein